MALPSLLLAVTMAASPQGPTLRFPYMPDNPVVGCVVRTVDTGYFGPPPSSLTPNGRVPATSDEHKWMNSVVSRYGKPSAVLDAEGCYADRRIAVYADDPSAVDPIRLANVDRGPSTPHCDGTPAHLQDEAIRSALAMTQPTGDAFYIVLSGPSTSGSTERIVHVDWTAHARARSSALHNRNCPRAHD